MCKKVSVDESFIKALPQVVSRPPEVRGSFDNMVIDQLEKELCTKPGEKYDARIDGLKPAMAECETNVVAASAALKLAMEDREKASVAFDVAQNEKRESDTALCVAKRSLQK